MTDNSKKYKPLVSVLMTAFNRENYIGEAIESVLISSYTNLELIIVDDGSKDRTVDIAKEYKETDSRIKIYVNEQNLGDYPNRNRAASYAKGEYIFFLDSDDKLFPDSLQKLITDVIQYSDFNFGMYCNHVDYVLMLAGDEALNNHFYKKQFLFIGPGGTIMKRDFFQRIGGYPEKYGPANDMYFNLLACCNSSVLLIPYDFFFYRRHEGQEINNRFGYMYNNYNYMRDALTELAFPFSKKQISWLKKKNKRRFVVHLFKYLYRTWNFRKGFTAYQKAEFTFFDILQAVFH
jgi:glycosyltransferase involved in cell wall biosynthesis